MGATSSAQVASSTQVPRSPADNALLPSYKNSYAQGEASGIAGVGSGKGWHRQGVA